MTAPVVYFIDDSATMREVIKIAFRRENIEVVACHDGESALAQMAQQPPDVVISDLIMPGKDGYEVCQSVKQNPGDRRYSGRLDVWRRQQAGGGESIRR